LKLNSKKQHNVITPAADIL